MATHKDIETRRANAAEILAQRGAASLAELAMALNVSQSTVRRDLEALEQAGLARRTHGGAICTPSAAGHRLDFTQRETTNLPAKRAVAKVISQQIITDGQTVILDGGTTCYQVAVAIAARPLGVVTNSVPIASLLYADPAVEVTLIGGLLYPRTGVTLGTMALRQLDGLHASLLVMSCAGVSRDGLFNVNHMMAEVELKMMQAADAVVLAVDHSKFARRSLAKICQVEQVDWIVTDSDTDPAHIEWLESLPVKLLVAPKLQEEPGR